MWYLVAYIENPVCQCNDEAAVSNLHAQHQASFSITSTVTLTLGLHRNCQVAEILQEKGIALRDDAEDTLRQSRTTPVYKRQCVGPPEATSIFLLTKKLTCPI